MNRRQTLWIAGVATAAAAAGLALQSLRRPPAEPASSADAALWTQTFPRPDGSPLTMASLRGRPLLLNFWATWCPPCVEELPMLDRFARAHPGCQVVGLAIDGDAAVRSFLAERPVGFPMALAQAGGLTLTRSLGNLQGGLPFSVLFDARGQAVDRKLGALTDADLLRWAKRVGA